MATKVAFFVSDTLYESAAAITWSIDKKAKH